MSSRVRSAKPSRFVRSEGPYTKPSLQKTHACYCTPATQVLPKHPDWVLLKPSFIQVDSCTCNKVTESQNWFSFPGTASTL
ncbi:hypothetical protein Avbf_01915, partial [Armadillidium vulgare]